MTNQMRWRRAVLALTAGAAVLLAGCSAPPAFQVSEQPVTQESVQNVNSTVGMIGGALVGGGLGSLVGGGRGQTVATVVGAAGGAFVGNQAAQRSQTLVWRIGVRYDDGGFATIQQTAAPNLRIGDRVRVTSNSVELLRG
jgi:outer membrane lipoprotein SlyB